MNKRYAEKIRDSKVWDRDFENWDEILNEGILKCEEISTDDKTILSIIRTGEMLKDIWEHQLEKDFNLSAAQLNILEALYFNKKPYLTQEEISKKVYCSRANASTILTRMQDKGLIKRQDNKQNKRQKQVILTKQGEETILHVFESFENCNKNRPNLFSNEQANYLIENLKEFRNKLYQLKH